MLTVEDVRKFLRELPKIFVGDDTIQTNVDFAIWEVDKEKSAYATQDDLDKAALIHAAYYTVLAYMAEAERSLGTIPPTLSILAAELRERLEKAMKYIKRGRPVPIHIYELSDSLWKYRTGNLSTE